MHQNRGGWGDAGTRSGIRRDVAMIKDLGMNLIRGSHYPHHPYFAEECDRQGLLFWSELHFWGIGGENVEGYWFASAYPVEAADEPEFEESLRRALREMIRTHRNHPSIITWSIGNEAFFSDDQVIGKAKALTSELVQARARSSIRPGPPRSAARSARASTCSATSPATTATARAVPRSRHPERGLGVPRRARPGPGEYEVEWEHGVEVDYPWRSGKILWCAFHYKSIADGAGLAGLADYWRMPRRPYHWYRERLRGIAPPAFPEPGTAVALRLSSDTETMPTDGTGDARLLVELVDERRRPRRRRPGGAPHGRRRRGPVPLGRSITLSPETDSLWGGAGAIELRSYAPGTQRIRATAEGLPRPTELVATGPAKPPRTRRLAPAARGSPSRPAGVGTPRWPLIGPSR